MWSEFLAYLQLGFLHITNVRGADHILFILALAVIYRIEHWREVAWVVTAFTVGHSITLALAVTGMVTFSSSLVEVLIAVTILVTAVENLFIRPGVDRGRNLRPMLALLFGFVHGGGFASYLRSLFIENVFLPLLGFNVGLELGQLMVLAFAVTLFFAFDLLVSKARPAMSESSTLRLRIVVFSTMIAMVAGSWTLERL